MKKTNLAACLSIVLAACGPKTAAEKPATSTKPAATSQAPAPAPSMKESTTAMATVDVEPLRTKWTPAEITAGCEGIEKTTDAKLAALVAIPDAKRTFADSFGALDAAFGDFGEQAARHTFMKDIHTDAAVREAAGACEERIGKYAVAVSARKDLYQAMKGYLANAGKSESLDAEQKRLIEITMRDFKRSGLELSDADREKLTSIRSRLSELGTKFATNLGEDMTAIEVTAAELEGLPKEFLARLKKSKDGKKLVVTTKYPDYYPVMENGKREATRRKLQVAFDNRGGAENLKLLAEAVKLRVEAAKLLGYATHTDYVAEDRMAKNAKTVNEFLARMRKGLEPGLANETAKMQKLKAAETKDPKAKIHAWDWRYYQTRIKEKEFAIDDEKVREFFPMDKVMAGLFETYSRLFQIDITPVSGVELWHDQGVTLYQVKDQGTGKTIAKFYMDMFPREGKYGHAAEFTLSGGRAVPGGYKIPFAALVMNFNPPAEGKAATLSVKEVETLFHEFGHVMHESLTTARYSQLAGTNTARDFVEAPSQMLENWVYQPEVLALISADPKDPSKPLPADLAKKLIAARKYNAGVHYSRQVFLASFDTGLHSTAHATTVDPDAIARTLWKEIMQFDEDPKSHFAGTFGHMMGGYDGGYYGYLWSEVFAADMFTRFEKEGVLNPKVGREYRDKILSKGRTVEPDVLLKDFLGREPNEAAFLRMTGIKSSS